MSEFANPEMVAVWRETAARRNAALGLATERMLALARIGPGMRVLDLGTGVGDVALLAAERVGERGEVVGTDISQPMVEAAQSAAAARVRFLQMDASALEFANGEFDAAVGRNVVMFLPDLDGALAGVRRVLRPGARFATIFWAPFSENPLQAALVETARAMGSLPEDAEMVVAFGLREEKLLAAMERAGFREIAVEHVRGEHRFESLAKALEATQASPVQRVVFARLDDASRARAWAEVARRWRPFETAEGLVVPLQSLVASGTA